MSEAGKPDVLHAPLSPQVVKPIQAQLELPTRDVVPYQKVDLVRLGRLGDDIAIAFFQLNYLHMIDMIEKVSSSSDAAPIVQTWPIPQAKVVMSRAGFEEFVQKVNELAKALQ